MTRDAKNLWFLFSCQVVLTVLCPVPEPRTAVFRVVKPSKKKKPLKNRTSSGNLELFKNLPQNPTRFLFLPHFENVKRSKPFKNLQEVLERFQVPRGFQRVSVDIFRVTGWSTQEPQNSSAVLFSSCTARLGILSTDSEFSE